MLLVAGQLSYPRKPKVTAEFKDLLARILVVDPQRRITLSGIQVQCSVGRCHGQFYDRPCHIRLHMMVNQEQ